MKWRMKRKMKVWDKLDEVIGAGLLATIAGCAMCLDYNGNVVAICATGIISLLAASAGSGKGGSDGPTST